MCDPKQLLQLSLGSNLAATGLKAGTQIMQARYESAALRQNEILASRQAQQAVESGAAQGSEITRQGDQVAAEQRVGMAGNGIDPSSSRSAVALLMDTAGTAATDAATARNNAGQTADALKTDAAQRKAARKTLGVTTPLAVGAGLLTGGSRAYGIYKKLTV